MANLGRPAAQVATTWGARKSRPAALADPPPPGAARRLSRAGTDRKRDSGLPGGGGAAEGWGGGGRLAPGHSPGRMAAPPPPCLPALPPRSLRAAGKTRSEREGGGRRRRRDRSRPPFSGKVVLCCPERFLCPLDITYGAPAVCQALLSKHTALSTHRQTSRLVPARVPSADRIMASIYKF